MHTAQDWTEEGPKESVDIPHVWLEVPETEVLEESRTMAMALLSEHNYETVTEHGFTFSQRPRIYEHGEVHQHPQLLSPHHVPRHSALRLLGPQLGGQIGHPSIARRGVHRAPRHGRRHSMCRRGGRRGRGR